MALVLWVRAVISASQDGGDTTVKPRRSYATNDALVLRVALPVVINPLVSATAAVKANNVHVAFDLVFLSISVFHMFFTVFHYCLSNCNTLQLF